MYSKKLAKTAKLDRYYTKNGKNQRKSTIFEQKNSIKMQKMQRIFSITVSQDVDRLVMQIKKALQTADPVHGGSIVRQNILIKPQMSRNLVDFQ